MKHGHARQASELANSLLPMRSVEGLIFPANFGTPDEAAIRVVQSGNPEEWVTQVSILAGHMPHMRM